MSKAITYILIIFLIIAATSFLVGIRKANAPVEEPSGASVQDISMQDINALGFGTTTLSVEVARTPAERTLGLSGRESLPENTGLLFIFEESDRHGIWMKDMKFAIDIFWLDQDLRIVHIERSVRPETFPDVFSPGEPALYVLETDAGFAENNNIKIGDVAQAI